MLLSNTIILLVLSNTVVIDELPSNSPSDNPREVPHRLRCGQVQRVLVPSCQ